MPVARRPGAGHRYGGQSRPGTLRPIRPAATSARTSLPPLRTTRPSSRAACCWFCAKMTPKVEITPSKLASGKGRRSASPSWKSMVGRTWADSSFAAVSSSGEISTALTRAPDRATLRADQPVPVATSRMCSFARVHSAAARHAPKHPTGRSSRRHRPCRLVPTWKQRPCGAEHGILGIRVKHVTLHVTITSLPMPMLIGLVSLAAARASGTLAHHAIERLLHLTPLSSFVRLRLPSTVSTMGLLNTSQSQSSCPLPNSVVSVMVSTLHILEPGGGELLAQLCRDPAAGRGGAADPSAGR